MNANRFNSIMDVTRNKAKVTTHVGKRPSERVITTEKKKLNMVNVRSDSVSVNNTSGPVFSKGIEVNAFSCGGFI